MSTGGRSSPLLGREDDLAVFDAVLDRLVDGPVVVEYFGDPGIGKTAIWSEAVRRASVRGLRVVSSRPGSGETGLGYAGLADMLEGLDPFDAPLTDEQRGALEAAVFRGVPVRKGRSNPRLIGVAFARTLAWAAQQAPVVLAIDDAQWLDRASLAAIRFAVRRCEGPVLVLVTARGAAPDGDRGLWCEPPPAGAHLRRTISPLAVEAVARLVDRAAGLEAVPLRVSQLIIRVAAGNPFYALQLLAAWQEGSWDGKGLPESLRLIVDRRLAGLPTEVGDVLLLIAAAGEARIEVLQRAVPGSALVSSIAAGQDAGIVSLTSGEVRFTHPVLAAGAYSRATPTARRDAHRRLAEAETELERSARHLALASIGPDVRVIDGLDRAAEAARLRGAVPVAAELGEIALALGADDVDRTLRTATDLFDCDAFARAEELTIGALRELPAGDRRAVALGLLGMIRFRFGDLGAAVAHLESAVDQAGGQVGLRASLAMDLAIAGVNAGNLDEAARRAPLIVRDAEASGDPGLLAEAIGAQALIALIHGEAIPPEWIERALELEERERMTPALRWPVLNIAMVRLFTGDFAAARTGLRAALERCRRRGQEADIWFVAFHGGEAALRLGNVEEAAELVGELRDAAVLTGSAGVGIMADTAEARLALWKGDIDRSIRIATDALGMFQSFGAPVPAVLAAGVLAAALNVAGDHMTAAEHVRRSLVDLDRGGFRSLGYASLLPEGIDAFCGAGAVDEAERLIDRADVLNAAAGSPWMAGLRHYGMGRIAAAKGLPGDARLHFNSALDAHGDEGFALERGRTALALAHTERRARRRTAGRSAATLAVTEFARVGSRGWEEVARNEESSYRRPTPGEALTPMERRVSDAVAGGATNRAAAAMLGISEKTVETHLASIYRKAGVQSRAEFGRWHARHPGDEQGKLPMS